MIYLRSVELGAFAAVFAACAGVWRQVFARRRAGLPILPLARRRPVPWLGRDVLLVFLTALFFIPWLASIAVEAIAAGAVPKAAADCRSGIVPLPGKRRDAASTHPAEQLLASGRWELIVLVEVLAVIVAPVFEEFLFRVVLQGWLEAVWSRNRRRGPTLRKPPRTWMPIVLPAAFFALIHFRWERKPPPVDYLGVQFVGQIPASLLAVAVVIVLLRLVAGATPADLGWQPRKLAGDVEIGFAALVAVMPALLVLQVALVVALKRRHLLLAPDPLPLFFLALVFGYLYQRTHRITPSLVLHASFNATSIALYFLAQ